MAVEIKANNGNALFASSLVAVHERLLLGESACPTSGGSGIQPVKPFSAACYLHLFGRHLKQSRSRHRCQRYPEMERRKRAKRCCKYTVGGKQHSLQNLKPFMSFLHLERGVQLAAQPLNLNLDNEQTLDQLVETPLEGFI